MKDEIFVVGIGMTPFGKFFDRSVKSLVHQAVTEALADAGANSRQIGAAFYANVTQGIIDGQHLIRGQVALRELRIDGIPIINVENACASGATAFHQAIAQLLAGTTEVALAVGVEKMYDEDKAKSFAIFSGGWDVHDQERVASSLRKIGEGMPPPAEKNVPSNSPFMELYASLARGHMNRFGTTERQLAAVAAKNHRHSTLNPLSQFRNDMSIEEVLAARTVCWPLTVPMSSPISDGAAAVILCTRRSLSRFPKARPVKVLASVLKAGSERDWADPEQHVCRKAADEAYHEAGVGPDDMSLAEVHDASAFAEIIQTENLGFCEIGQGGWLAERGETSAGGRIPVNLSGGLESKGHPIGATGLSQIYELCLQLRGEAGPRQVESARFALAENGGGFIGVEEAAAVVTVLASTTA
jgi:acetyl-CoA acetyltransferase